MLLEIEKVFRFLKQKRRPGATPSIAFRYLLVGQFNLQQQFLLLIEREIAFARKGIPAAITIKLNNLEDKVLISKLYDASRAGVHVSLIVRSVCCLIPGVPGMSENITVRRIIDRYLEHGRVFIFRNAGDEARIVVRTRNFGGAALHCVDQGHGAPKARQVDRGREPGRPAAHHGHVGAVVHGAAGGRSCLKCIGVVRQASCPGRARGLPMDRSATPDAPTP
jgi:hypothetical protein